MTTPSVIRFPASDSNPSVDTTHRVLFYDSEAFLLTKVCEFAAAARREGACVVVIASAPHLLGLKAMLAQQGSDAQQFHAGAEQIVWRDAHEVLARFMVDGMPDETRFAVALDELLSEACAAGTRRISAFGEMVAVLYAEGNARAALRLERLWEAAIARHRIDLLCAYPMSAFPDAAHRRAFASICDVHSHVDPLEHAAPASADCGQVHRLQARLQQTSASLERELARSRENARRVNAQRARINALDRAQRVLKELVGHDALTGLCNRRAFTDCLSHAFARARRTQASVALLFVDLDDFKLLNDRFGHAAGDRLLAEAGARLMRCARGGDTVCRIGGDEFTVVLENAGAADAALLAERVVDAFAEEFAFDSGAVRLSASIGIGVYPDNALSAEALIRSADKAMYRAKALGKGRYATSRAATLAGQASAAAEGGSARAPAPALPAGRSADWMTVEAVALKLGLSRPHVVKLIAERQFNDVVRRDDALPLIPAAEVNRVAQAMQLSRPADAAHA